MVRPSQKEEEEKEKEQNKTKKQQQQKWRWLEWSIFWICGAWMVRRYAPPENVPITWKASKITGNVFISISAEIIWSIFCHHFFLHTDVHLTRKKNVFTLNRKTRGPFAKAEKKVFRRNHWLGYSPSSPIAPWSFREKFVSGPTLNRLDFSVWRQTLLHLIFAWFIHFSYCLLKWLFVASPTVIRIGNWPFWTHVRPGYLGSHLWVQTSTGSR